MIFPIKHYTWLFLLGICCFLFSCRQNHHNVTRGFYYWKTAYKPTAYELKTLKQAGCKKLYIRLCDLDLNKATQQVQPIGILNFRQQPDTSFQYIPVIFITQPALASIEDSAISQLAVNIDKLVSGMCAQASVIPPEIQIDCDWNSSTKEKYFRLLQQLKQQAFFKNKILSCTVRMHQAKYVVRNDIPPVDKGLLMCYNMGNIKKPGNRNSILDPDEAKDYLKYINTYPLPLDIALPLFDWCLLFRNNKWFGILRDVTPDMIKQATFFKHQKDNLYICTTDALFAGYYFKKADCVRVEAPDYNDIKNIAAFTAQKVKNRDMNVIFFHCDSIVLNKFPTYELEKIYSIYN